MGKKFWICQWVKYIYTNIGCSYTIYFVLCRIPLINSHTIGSSIGKSDASRSCVLHAAQYAVWDLGADEIPEHPVKVVSLLLTYPAKYRDWYISGDDCWNFETINSMVYVIAEGHSYGVKVFGDGTGTSQNLPGLFWSRTSTSLIETMLSIIK